MQKKKKKEKENWRRLLCYFTTRPKIVVCNHFCREIWSFIKKNQEAIGLWVMFESRGNTSTLPFVCSKAGFLDNGSVSVALGTPFSPKVASPLTCGACWFFVGRMGWVLSYALEMLSRHPRASYPLKASSNLPSRFWQWVMSPVTAKCPLVEWGG